MCKEASNRVVTMTFENRKNRFLGLRLRSTQVRRGSHAFTARQLVTMSKTPVSGSDDIIGSLGIRVRGFKNIRSPG